MKSIIQARELVRSYGTGPNQFSALKGVSIDIQDGDSVAITGKSGSGKSTLMHILALLDKPSSGELHIGGVETGMLSPRELSTIRNENFGFVFQQFFLNGKQTVLENVMLPLEIAGVPKRQRIEAGMETLSLLGIEAKAENRAMDLSGGQKQRVAIARALVNNPKVIFADEPTGNLDTNTGERVEELLFSLNREQGITLVVVTHDNDFASKFDRQIEVRDGLISNPELIGAQA